MSDTEEEMSLRDVKNNGGEGERASLVRELVSLSIALLDQCAYDLYLFRTE